MRRWLLVVGVTVALLLGSIPAVAAQEAPHCPPGVEPHYVFGFATLHGLLGNDIMGQPLTCEFADPRGTGDTLQMTTEGLAFWRQATNTPTFTNGWDHWAWTAQGLVYWEGEEIDPPAHAVSVSPPAVVAPPPPPEPEPIPTPPVVEDGCLPGQVNINTAPSEELRLIIHIDEVRAAEMIQLREQRPFASVHEMTRITGIGEVRLQDILEQGLACVE